MAERVQQDEIEITTEQIDGFLEGLKQKGRGTVCIQSYRVTLLQMYQWLGEDKYLTEGRLQEWRNWLNEQQYSARTLNARMSAMNHFLKYIGRKRWYMEDYIRDLDMTQPELSREEYRRLLHAAKQLGKEKPYLLVKVMGGAGVRIQELPQVTVEAVRKGSIVLEGRSGRRTVRILTDLQQELLSFAKREGILEGPLFLTREGESLSRSSVWQYIKGISRDARVPEERATPRCLWKMYKNTYADIEKNITSLVEQAYERIMEEEQRSVGWEE